MAVDWNYLVREAQDFLAKREAARLATNEANQAQTRLKKAYLNHRTENNYPADFAIGIGECVIGYGVAFADKVSAAKVIDMYNNGEITAAQLAEIIDVRKEDAKRVLGGDVVDTLSTKVAGKEADIRLRKPDEGVTYETPTAILPVAEITNKPAPNKTRAIKLPPKVAAMPTRQGTMPLKRIAKV